MFKEFNSRFEETVFTLIAKFNEVKDSFNRVQEGLDFLGKVRIQIAENKVLTSKLTQSFKDLERKIRNTNFNIST